MEEQKEARYKAMLEAAGVLADVTRRMVGGKNFTLNYRIPPCDISTVSEHVKIVREALDKYDRIIKTYSLYH